MRVWRFKNCYQLLFVGFQLTHPWGCDQTIDSSYWLRGNFNSHTREGVTPQSLQTNPQLPISTHTPVRVWQLFLSTGLNVKIISTHTPVRVWLDETGIQHYTSISTHTPVRVWRSQPPRPHNLYYFNSHTREGVTSCRTYKTSQQHFNSHTREGVTPCGSYLNYSAGFQLTHPWGCDIFWIEERDLYPVFQLTHPWGCDYQAVIYFVRDEISTHTPVRVWRSGKQNKLLLQSISTHTPVRVWQSYLCELNFQFDFNSHTREGVTWACIIAVKEQIISTHTPVRVWLYIVKGCKGLKNFNSHTREGVT